MFEQAGEKVYGNSGNPALVGLLHSPGAKRILDLGCGSGSNLALLRRADNRTVGLTLSALEALEAHATGLGVVVADLTRSLPFVPSGQFDVVVLSHVLEHLVDPVAVLRSVRGVLAQGGVLAIAVPSVTHYAVRLRHLLGDWTYGDAGILDWTHLRFFSLAGIVSVIREADLRIVKEGHDGALPWWFLRQILPAALTSRIDRIATRRWPELFANQFLFLVEPSDGRTGRFGTAHGAGE